MILGGIKKGGTGEVRSHEFLKALISTFCAVK